MRSATGRCCSLLEDELLIAPDDTCNELPPDILEATERDKHYTQIVEAFKQNYIAKSKKNHVYKAVFFYAVIAILAFIVLGFAMLCVGLLVAQSHWEVVLPVMGGGVTTVVVALLKLPQIVAKHLFPRGEDKIIVELIHTLKSD
jgi:hypothetical protein